MPRLRFAVLLIFVFATLASAQVKGGVRTEKVPPEFAQAEKLFQGKRWKEAEKAFLHCASSSKDNHIRYESRRKAALCLGRAGQASRSAASLTQLIREEAAYKYAPDTVAQAF